MAQIVHRLRVTVNGHEYDVTVEDQGTAASASPAAPPAAAPAAAVPASDAAAGAGEVCAPLPGVIADVKVKAGQNVERGQVLLVLEAMKMENEVTAPAAGTIRSVRVERGDQVAAKQVLLVMG